MFGWLKSKEEAPMEDSHTWDPHTMTMQLPQPPPMAVTNQNRVVSEQPRQPEPMHLSLRGGGEGEDVCCGICAGLACYECCKCCC
ncbi:hypothetical protein BDV26DRAFT_269712 [Aspergillus bertholletiae]|uniref:Cysteine-rich transmembrane CYSTM domain-containing protein n=1 Tax=Aspergillus bertholletiae TaxID=1226010 RepID=A0A5N7B094_9EURO|nr:hypothetical protein BDV26DRAFT_269712 [Aspergillus bertholletiae]